MKRIMMLIGMLVIATALSPLAKKEIKGTVNDEQGLPIPGVSILIKGTTNGTVTDLSGQYELFAESTDRLVFNFIGYVTQEITIGQQSNINVNMVLDVQALEEIVVVGYGTAKRFNSRSKVRSSVAYDESYSMAPMESVYEEEEFNTEEYDGINENIFHNAKTKPLSTFSIDVDAASYSNMRRFITNGQQPPKDAVRIEEMINYFNYDYAQPKGDVPFSVNTEIAVAPWNPKHQLVHIGLQGKEVDTEGLPASNLVFLLDVSGSMNNADKLPLLKSGFKLLVQQLRPEDRVAIVVYAGAAGVVLPSTSGDRKGDILKALDQLEAGGSTAGGAGIRLAYKIAKDNFKIGGNNRIILATDGDFNIGESSNASMEELIEEKREEGVFLTVLGFGTGNYKDSKMETIADKGNGNYAYIDNILEAKKVLVNEFGGTLFTIAKDVKLQVEFNPNLVQAYRLIGYENRALRDEDFNDDKKDAGELGSGHTVTALYEIIPVGVDREFTAVDPLKYQESNATSAATSSELLNIKLRYKAPDGTKSML
ncbi:MAG: von Willebrand factor type A domain-containing protein, partial [Reichenbachiella sp.]